MPSTWERITYRPEGAERCRSIILRDPTPTSFFEPAIIGVEVDKYDDEIAPAGVDERRHIISASLICKRTPLVMDNFYGWLVKA